MTYTVTVDGVVWDMNLSKFFADAAISLLEDMFPGAVIKCDPC